MSKVLLIFADDMRADLLRYMPFVSGVLAAEGTTFTKAYCNVPVCQPARVAILTGQYAYHSGIHQNSNQAEWPTGYDDTIGTWAQSGGFETGMFGKAPNGYRTTGALRPGWDTWRIFTGLEQENLTYHLADGVGGASQPGTPQTPTVASLVSTFITTAGDRFAWWNPTNPHINNSAIKNNPSAASMKKFDWVNWDLDLLLDDELAGKPTWTAGAPQWTASEQKFMRAQARQQIRECWDLDQAIAGIYADLEDANLLDETTIIFTSDGGVFYGEQRTGNIFLAGKNNFYDPCARIPMIIRGPDFTAGRYCDTAVSLQDVSATILDITGGTSVLTLDGTSLIDIMAVPDDSERPILYERQTDVPTGGEYPDAQGVITGRYKMIRYVDGTGLYGDPLAPVDFSTNPNDEYEMYDLDTDPGEKVNLAYLGGAHLTKRNELEAVLDSLLNS